jgi:hypothetical protein
MRALAFLFAGLSAASANGQAIVKSAGPDRVAVTVYRDPNRGTGDLNLGWLGGIAIVSETRHVSLPAGDSELRFEGVTGGIVPQTAIVTGLGEAVLEKNRDARLLSPGALLNAYLAQRVSLRRTAKATGVVRQQDAVIRATHEGVVLQTADGFEALRCTGLAETLIAPSVPADLSAKPTLSVRVRSPGPIETDVTLSYISNNFDWQANYVAELSADGKQISLFSWLTMANGDETALADAATQVVAGKVNYQRVWVNAGEAPPIQIQCWPSQTTSDLPDNEEVIVVTGSRIAYAAPSVPPPPPPPPPQPERGGDEMMAQEERFGDFRLYRVPIAVTVAPKSQKQVALMRRPTVKVDSVLRHQVLGGGQYEVPLERILVTRNRQADGLGLAMPAGKFALFGRSGDRRILLGEGTIDDHSVGEKVEFKIATSPTIQARQIANLGSDQRGYELTISNDSSTAQPVEIELPLEAKASASMRLVKRDGRMLWRPSVPANGTATLRYRL